jgi:GntR family transcriptional repressor for pyruvate dehydrogenase complex
MARSLIGSPVERSGDEAEYVALRELGASDEPLGCWRIRTALGVVGIEMSEATAGRLLRQLDLRGLTRALGSKGRVLTDHGRDQLAAYEKARSRSSHHADLALVISAQTVEDLLDVLHARRLIEAETCRLAALHATPEEIAELAEAVQRHIAVSRAGGASLENNVSIHRLIARASRSRILQAIVGLFLQDQQLHEAQNRIQRAVGGIAPEDHSPVLDGIRARDPAAAAAAMCAHIDRLIRGCEDTIRARQEADR